MSWQRNWLRILMISFQEMKKIFTLTLLITLTEIVSAQTLGAIKDKYVYVGIPSNEFSAIASFGKQHSMNWCWAALS